MGHHCHALRCTVAVPPRMHMCGRHWSRVPRRLQRDLWAAYRFGQEQDKDPSAAYLRAAAACIRAVAEKEHHPADEIDAECELYLSWARRIDPDTSEPVQGRLV
jgi:diadenosine tetraphosphatase ApaH/serine/threonine PP2A family protein phosphatase